MNCTYDSVTSVFTLINIILIIFTHVPENCVSENYILKICMLALEVFITFQRFF